MIPFPQIALLLAAAWFLLLLGLRRSRRSQAALAGGLLTLGMLVLGACALGWVRPADFGLAFPDSWVVTLVYALAGLGVLLAWSPLADRLAARLFARPPDLRAFQTVQRSGANLFLGIAAAWLLGGFLEELVARGIVLKTLATLLAPLLGAPGAVFVALCIAASGAGLLHLYQGPRAAAIITQLSLLFGFLFVVSGANLWTVILAHGLYDTIAFIRFASGRSKYSHREDTDRQP